MIPEGGPPEELLTARRSLEGLEGFSLLKDWEWHESTEGNAPQGRWVLNCRLSPPVEPAGPIPASTDWYILVDPAYPWGSIKFYPAKDGGITQTFPHQNYNARGEDGCLWRTGDLCLGTQLRSLGRHAYDVEPFGIHERLRWHAERAMRWLEDASRDELLRPGEPFELPQVLPAGGLGFTFAFQEGPETLTMWEDSDEKAGLVDLFGLRPDKSVLLVDRFLSGSKETVLALDWGKSVADASKERVRGLWIRLKSVPLLYPWQNPVIWSELRKGRTLTTCFNKWRFISGTGVHTHC